MSNSELEQRTAEKRVTDVELEKAIIAFREAVEAEPLAAALGGYLDADQVALRAMLELQQIRRKRG
jgi:hypothetical protein